MKYLLLCALVISGAFFSQPIKADPLRCPDGGTYQVIDGIEMCTVPPDSGIFYDCYVQGVKRGTFKGPESAALQSCIGVGWGFVPPAEPPYTCNPIEFPPTTSTSSAQLTRRYHLLYSDSGICNTAMWQNKTVSVNVGNPQQQTSCPPADHPGFFKTYPVADSFICWKEAITPECDCANFAGQSLNTRNTLRAPKGQYTNENPPQCVMQQEFVAGRDTPLTCTCQVSAQKWMKTNSGFENGVEYERWETLPTTQGQPSGTFTGVKCGSTDGGPLEPENNAPKECFTLPNGVRWCWADKAEKCQVVNGVEQCASGCGTVNGDFVCYDDKPVIPPKDRDNLTPPDDTLTDPSKSINDMVKSDFKEVNKGVETRLDNVVTSISNTTIAMDEVSDKVGLTNSKLDGIGMQLDGVGKQLGAIDGKLEGAFGDKGQPMPGTGDGKNCHEEVCSWYESAYPDGLVGIWEERSLALQQTALFDFVNQFSFEPSGSQPEMQLCFNLASYANFGCFSLEIPAFVWVFLRVCILFSAAMLCRALIFGG